MLTPTDVRKNLSVGPTSTGMGSLAAGITASAAALVAYLVVGAAPAVADGGAGAPNGGPLNVNGGAGGAGFNGSPGADGGTAFISTGSGGGGGGAGGGNGGTGGVGTGLTPPTDSLPGGPGGPGGTAGNPNGVAGQPGGSGTGDGTPGELNTAGGGGGGGGGFNGIGGTTGVATINNSAAIAGGKGGAGGAGGTDLDSAGGGGGGAGGYGAVVTGNGASMNVGTIRGGTGGAGGMGGGDVIISVGAGSGGAGGDGGIGIFFSAPGASLNNSGAIAGGNGGAGGLQGVSYFGPGSNGANGAGGAGVVGAGLTIINSGAITGGLNGDGVTRANAIAFTGGTNVLELLAGSTITGNVVAFSAADTLRLGGAGNASFDVSQIGAQYLGFGIFQKNGSSIWTLTGTNVAASPWTINAGTLNVTGTMANSAVTVNNGGTLAGTGTVGATTVNSGGTFAPGSGLAGGTMKVAGNLAFQSGALFLIQLGASANVSGTATLGGATVSVTYPGGGNISKQYAIVTAANVGGTFGSLVNTNLPANFSASLSYDAKDAYLDVALNFAPSNGAFGANQQGVANAIVNFFNSNGSLPIAFGSLTPAGLTQLSGEAATGSQQTTFDAMNLFMGTMLDPFNRGTTSTPGGGASGYAPEADAIAYASTKNAGAAHDAYAMFTKVPPAVVPFEQRWSVWASGFGGSQTTDGNPTAGSNNTTSSVYGTAVGADYRISPNTLAGFALAGGGTNFSVANSGSGHSDLFQAGAFIRHTVGSAYISAALAYGWQDITTNRTVTAAGISQLRAQFDANAFSGRLEGGYRFVAPWVGGIGITPYAAAQFTTFDLPGYAEQAVVGSNAFALAYGAKDITDTRSELGIRTDKSWAMTDGILTLRGRVAWAHDFDPDRSIAATFQSLPGASFVVNGAAQAADSALVTASVEKKWLTGWSAAATFEGEFSDVTRSYAGKGVVRYTW
jgi:uncharacterized protein with beta-barrel porin domain